MEEGHHSALHHSVRTRTFKCTLFFCKTSFSYLFTKDPSTSFSFSHSHSVFRNGDILHPGMRLIIPRHMQKNLEQILSLISEKAMLRTGAVRRYSVTHIVYFIIYLWSMSYLYPHTLFKVVFISQSIHLSPLRLCTLEGYTVTSTEELESGQSYVAVGTERFKKLPYVEILLNKATGNSADRWCWWIIGIDNKLYKILGSRFF